MDMQKDIQEAMVIQHDIATDRELEEELEDLLVEEENSNDDGSTKELERELEELKIASPPKEPPEIVNLIDMKNEDKEANATL